MLAAGDEVEGIAFPEAEQAVNDYPIAALTGAPDDEAAAAFVEHVLSEDLEALIAEATDSKTIIGLARLQAKLRR